MLKKRRGGKEKKRKKKKRESVAARVFVQRSIEKSKEERRRNGIDRYIFIIYIYIYIHIWFPHLDESGNWKAKEKRFESTSREYSGLPCTCWSGTTRKRKRERDKDRKYVGSRELIDEERTVWSIQGPPLFLVEQIYIYIYIYIYINEHAPTKSPPLGEWNC